jgi:hypothetical protein
MVPSRPPLERCALCGRETACRMEVAGRMRPLCPDCIPVLTAGTEAEALARALVAGALARFYTHRSLTPARPAAVALM